MPRLFALLIVLLCLTSVNQLHAQDVGASDRVEMMYVVRNAPASDVAKTLEKFLAEARGAEVVVDPQSNVLLMRAPAGAIERIKGILKELDRSPSMVAVEVWLVIGDADAIKAVNLSAESDDPLKQLEALQSKGQTKVINHLRLSTLDNQPSFMQIGERTPMLRAASSASSDRSRLGAGTSRSYSYESIGTLVKVTPRVIEDRAIAMEIQIEKSRHDHREAGEEGSSVPPVIVTSTFESTIRLADGKATLLTGGTSSENGNAAVSFAIVRATILEQQ